MTTDWQGRKAKLVEYRADGTRMTETTYNKGNGQPLVLTEYEADGETKARETTYNRSGWGTTINYRAMRNPQKVKRLPQIPQKATTNIEKAAAYTRECASLLAMAHRAQTQKEYDHINRQRLLLYVKCLTDFYLYCKKIAGKGKSPSHQQAIDAECESHTEQYCSVCK